MTILADATFVVLRGGKDLFLIVICLKPVPGDVSLSDQSVGVIKPDPSTDIRVRLRFRIEKVRIEQPVARSNGGLVRLTVVLWFGPIRLIATTCPRERQNVLKESGQKLRSIPNFKYQCKRICVHVHKNVQLQIDRIFLLQQQIQVNFKYLVKNILRD